MQHIKQDVYKWRNEVDGFISNVIAGIRFMIIGANWIDIADKETIEEKIDKIKVFAAAPIWIGNDTEIEAMVPAFQDTLSVLEIEYGHKMVHDNMMDRFVDKYAGSGEIFEFPPFGKTVSDAYVTRNPYPSLDFGVRSVKFPYELTGLHPELHVQFGKVAFFGILGFGRVRVFFFLSILGSVLPPHFHLDYPIAVMYGGIGEAHVQNTSHTWVYLFLRLRLFRHCCRPSHNRHNRRAYPKPTSKRQPTMLARPERTKP